MIYMYLMRFLRNILYHFFNITLLISILKTDKCIYKIKQKIIKKAKKKHQPKLALFIINLSI